MYKFLLKNVLWPLFLLELYSDIIKAQKAVLVGNIYQKLQSNQVIKGESSAMYEISSNVKCSLK